jgi:hypothetical protein
MTYQRLRTPNNRAQQSLTNVRARSAKFMSAKLAEVCRNLKPLQSLEFDPASGTVIIVTELVVPSSDEDQIAEILLHYSGNTKVLIRRLADTYKIALTRRLRV